MDWLSLDLEPVPWSMSYDDGVNDDAAEIEDLVPPVWNWVAEEKTIEAKRAIVSMTRLTSAFLQVLFPQRTLRATILIEKFQKMSLVDSSIGGIDKTKAEVIGHIFIVDQSDDVIVEFEGMIEADRSFEIAQLLDQRVAASSYTVLNELDGLNYISENPSERIVSPLLRILSTQNQGDKFKCLEAPNIIDGIPAALLSMGVYYGKQVDVFMSLVDGYQVKEDSLKAFEQIFPEKGEKSDKHYQEILSHLMNQTNNPLYM